MTIRIHQANDRDASWIPIMTRAAFKGKPYATGGEARMALELGDASALVLSLVVRQNKRAIGHVALSPAKVGDQKCLALAPLAVEPREQGKGIGSALVNHAVAVAGAYGRGGVLVKGDPAFFTRLGFKPAKGVTYRGTPSEQLLIAGFDAKPEGEVQFHPVLEA